MSDMEGPHHPLCKLAPNHPGQCELWNAKKPPWRVHNVRDGMFGGDYGESDSVHNVRADRPADRVHNVREAGEGEFDRVILLLERKRQQLIGSGSEPELVAEIQKAMLLLQPPSGLLKAVNEACERLGM